MALTDTEKLKVVRLLGWPGHVLTVGSMSYNNTVVKKLEALSTPMEEALRLLLETVEGLDAKREAALCRASTKEVGDIVLNENELTILTTERRRLLGEISDLLELMIFPGSSQANRGMVNVCV